MTDPKTLERAWREVAERVGGTFQHGGGIAPAVQRREGHWILTLAWTGTDTGSLTTLRAPFHNPRRVRLRLRLEGVMDDLWKKLGFLQEVDSGDRAFDRRFLVRGRPRSVVGEVVGRERVRELLARQRFVDVRVIGRAFEPALPRGVDQLHFQALGAVVDVDRLTAMFELFLEILPVISPEGRAGHEDADALLARLLAPGGVVRAPLGGYVLWDGDAPRREAAALLGRFREERAVDALLGALAEDDEGLVTAAASSLGEIGDRRAVAPLVGLLGERRRTEGGEGLAAHAALALERLGRSDVVRAFERALEGEPDALAAAAGEHRSEVVRALMAVVDSADFGPRAHAARALGTLGAAEALPLLRSRAYAWGMKTTLTEAAKAAVEEIERRVSLPRPASAAPGDRDTLPRPASGGEAGSETLPRPAREDDA